MGPGRPRSRAAAILALSCDIPVPRRPGHDRAIDRRDSLHPLHVIAILRVELFVCSSRHISASVPARSRP